jgi:putative endonuclease
VGYNNPLIPAKAGIQAFLIMAFYAYIVASQRNGTLYIGSTDNLAQRVWNTPRSTTRASPPNMMLRTSSGTKRTKLGRLRFAANVR